MTVKATAGRGRFGPPTSRVIGTGVAIVAAVTLAAPAAMAQNAAGWRPAMAVGAFTRAGGGPPEGTGPATLARTGFRASLGAERWLSSTTGVRIGGGALFVPEGNTQAILCIVDPGPGGIVGPCPQPGGNLTAVGGELALLNDPGGHWGRSMQVDVGIGLYRTVSRPVGVIEPTAPMINILGAHLGWSVALAGPLRLDLRVQTLGAGFVRVGAGAGLAASF